MTVTALQTPHRSGQCVTYQDFFFDDFTPVDLEHYKACRHATQSELERLEAHAHPETRHLRETLPVVIGALNDCIAGIESGIGINWPAIYLREMGRIGPRDLNWLNVVLRCEGNHDELRDLGLRWTVEVVTAALSGTKLNIGLDFDNPVVLQALSGYGHWFDVDFLRAPDADVRYSLKVGRDDLNYLHQCRNGVWQDAMHTYKTVVV